MKFTKEEISGFAGSILFCFLLILLLYFIVLRTKIPTEESGVLVNFGTVDWSSGTFEPRAQETDRSVIPEETVLPELVPVAPIRYTPPAITQNQEETAAIEAAKREREENERRRKIQEEAEQRRIAEAKRIADEEARRREEINRQVSGAFGAGTSNQSQEGTAASGTGNQGSSMGNAATGASEGAGGHGSFDLTGRSLGPDGLPKPSYSAQIEGRIVVNITVDSKGNVISAQVGQGTNIDNASMRDSAEAAARRAKFNSITGTNNQSGKIIYNYRLN